MMCPHRNRQPSRRRLYRDGRRAWLAGVCAGLADYFGVSPGLVRFLVFVSAVFFTFPTLLGYLIASFVLERRPADMYENEEEERFGRSVRLEPARTARDITSRFQDLERRLRAAEARVTSSEFKLRRQFRDIEG
jgi:phage shock protein C